MHSQRSSTSNLNHPTLPPNALAAGVLGIVGLKALQFTPPPTDSPTDVAVWLAPYLGLVAAAGLALAAGKVKQYVQESFYFKDYVQSRSGQ